ncbi:ABC transporter permease [Polymorphospora lycopeni]|uniref:ABC transporter permease n=1 Tax=Polymorphospora lycopeni TaxID=3140240 RepID=A0ABV5CVS1_9ACTN
MSTPPGTAPGTVPLRPFWRRRPPARWRGRGRLDGRTRALWRRPMAVISITVILVWLLAAALAPVLPGPGPLAQDAGRFEAPSGTHWFGTDELGRDVFSRVLYGARTSLPLAVMLVALSLVAGTVLGALAGYFRGWVDSVLMRLCDLLFAFPGIVLAMVVTAVLGPSVTNAMLALVIISWPWYARIVRGLVISIGDAEYVSARRLLGVSAWRTLVEDVLPNIAGPVLVLATLDLGGAILLLSGLSFLGLGAQPPAAEWGLMVSSGTQYFQFWWVSTFPGLAIFSVVLAFNCLGDTLRDVFDPQTSFTRAPSAGAGGTAPDKTGGSAVTP